jgi:hypothetical protein
LVYYMAHLHIFAAYGILTCVSVGQEGSNDIMNL